MNGDGITTAEAFAVLDEHDVEALVLLEEIPAFADELAEQFANDYCRSEMSVDEIAERQYLAGVYIAPVVSLSIPANQRQLPAVGRRAA